jgi:hypothetical protein
MDGSSDERADGPEPWGLLASARRLGGYAWTERRLFEVVGSWVAGSSDPELAVLFDVQSRHHAADARVLIERLPELRELPRAEAVTAPAGGWGAFVDGLDEVATDVTPHLVVTYRAHADRVGPVADAPLLRSLAVVTADLEADRARAEVVLDRLAADGDGGDRVGPVVSRAADALAATDGLAGPPLDVDVLA